MKSASVILATLLLAIVCFAQQPTDQPATPSTGPATDQTAPSGADQTQNASAQATSPEDKGNTIRGCLEAGTDHSYTVTDKNGIRYTLTGMDANALSSHVGEEVEADGEPTTGGNASSGAGPSTDKPAASPSQSFKVNGDVRKVSDKCAM